MFNQQLDGTGIFKTSPFIFITILSAIRLNKTPNTSIGLTELTSKNGHYQGLYVGAVLAVEGEENCTCSLGHLDKVKHVLHVYVSNTVRHITFCDEQNKFYI